jgi:CBS domain-containing protein
MSKNVRSVPVEETVENLYNKMQETRCRHIPIVDGPRVVGVVTMRGILEWLTQEIKEENLFLKNYIQS